MKISVIASVVTIIAGILTIIQVFKEFNKSKSKMNVQQINSNGINYHFDNSKTVYKTNNNQVTNYNTTANNSKEVDPWLIVVGGGPVLNYFFDPFFSNL